MDSQLELKEHIRTDELDPVTSLPPRRSLDEDLPALLHAMGVAGMPLSALMVDIDNFKKFNDNWGHEIGDMVLLHVASLIRGVVSYRGEAYRYGGEEITVLLPNFSPEEAICTAERVCRAVRRSSVKVPKALLPPVEAAGSPRTAEELASESDELQRLGKAVDGGEGEDSGEGQSLSLGVTISLGVSGFPMVGGDELLVTADHALLQAKRNGKDQAWLYSREKGADWRPNVYDIDVKFPGNTAIREGSFILLTHWFSHRNDPRDLEARGISDPGQKTRDIVDGPMPSVGMITSEIRGKVKDVERRQSATYFTLEVEEEVLELILSGLGIELNS